jgi:Sugar (and other) transporter.
VDEKVVSLEAEKFTAPAIRAVISQVLGYFFDAYDLLIVLSLATVLNRVFLPPNVPVLLSQIAILSGFVLSEVVRPLGSFVFGHYADKLGRKITLIITVIGYSVSGALVAALPSYTVAGYLGFIIYLILRFLVGFLLAVNMQEGIH